MRKNTPSEKRFLKMIKCPIVPVFWMPPLHTTT